MQNAGVFTFCLVNVLGATAPCNFSTSQLQKMVRSRCVLYILICKCASRYSNFKKVLRTRQFFNILNFDFQMGFWLQRRAIFPHPKFKKRAVPVSFFTFWLANVLLATAACHFSTSQLQKVVRECVLYILTWKCASRLQRRAIFHLPTSKNGPPWGVLYILTCKRASRHSGVQF